MTHIYNQPARTQKNSDFGHVWEEKISDALGSIEVPKYAAVRVRATGASTVTIAGTLAATMLSGEVMIFNSGIGNTTDTKKTVTVTIAVAKAYVQVARTVEPTSPAA